MKLPRSVARAASALILCAALVACDGGPSQTDSSSKTKGRIAVVVSTLNNPWFVVLANTARDEARARNYEVTIFDSQNDPAKEAAHFENIVASRYSAVLFNATDADGSVANVMKAKTAEIPVFTMDREVNSQAPISQVLSDNYSGAVDVGIEFVRAVGEEGKYVELLGLVTDNNTWNRSKGFHSVVDRYPGLKMVAQQSAEFDRSKALEVMEAILQRDGDIDAVFCGNDAMALGAYQALLGAGLEGKVKLFGFDGSEDALQAIADGKLTATAMQYPKVMARLVADFADRYLRGERELPARLPVHVDLVTRENIAEFGNYASGTAE
jgi:ABC-type sugar transport system substrate-binding protein